MQQQIKIPNEFLCSLTHKIMLEPVKAKDGFHYERKAISEWVSKHDNSPVTNHRLPSKELEENTNLKNKIRLWLKYHPQGAWSTFIKEVKAKNLQAVEREVYLGINANQRDEEGYMALHYAAKNDDHAMALLLLNNGADIDGRTKIKNLDLPIKEEPSQLLFLALGMQLVGHMTKALQEGGWEKTPLHIAAQHGAGESLIKLLLDRGANFEACDEYGHTPLELASRSRSKHICKILCDRGAKVEGNPQKSSSTPLGAAAYYGSLNCFNFLLEAGANINGSGKTKNTVLMDACSGFARALETNLDFYQKDCKQVIDLLIAKGVNVRAVNSDSQTALHFAVRADSEQIIDCLLKAGVDINAQDNEGTTALAKAVNFGYLNSIKRLIEGGANINIVNKKGQTPLCLLLDNKDITPAKKVEIINLLSQHGANPHAGNLLHKAVIIGDQNILRALIKTGVDIEQKDSFFLYDSAIYGKVNAQNATPLHRAAYQGNQALVELLLEEGADYKALTKDNKTPADLAILQKNDALATFIVQKHKALKNSMPAQLKLLKQTVENQKNLLHSQQTLIEEQAKLLQQVQQNVNASKQSSLENHLEVLSLLKNNLEIAHQEIFLLKQELEEAKSAISIKKEAAAFNTLMQQNSIFATPENANNAPSAEFNFDTAKINFNT